MAKNTKGEQTKNKLIECAADLFFKNGYNATGINDILKVTELPKGSFYFHFASKKDLAIQVDSYFENQLATWILNTAKGRNWEEFIRALVGDMINGAKVGTYFGCPLTTLGQELAFLEPNIAKYYSDSLKKMIYVFSSVLERSGVPKEKVDELANQVFVMYEGSLVYFRISKDTKVLEAMADNLIALYKSYL